MQGLKIDRESGVPIYVQIAQQLRGLIASGKIRPGERLPTVRQLAVELRINPNTVARIYVDLEREGLIAMQQGRGTFVVGPGPSPDPEQARRQRLCELVGKAIDEAIFLGYAEAEVEEAVQSHLLSLREQIDSAAEAATSLEGNDASQT